MEEYGNVENEYLIFVHVQLFNNASMIVRIMVSKNEKASTHWKYY
jgi:hypothetical protein